MTTMPTVRLPLRLRTLVHERGPDEVKPAVRCPRQGRSIDALRCTGCARMRAIEWEPEVGGVIECQVEPDQRPERAHPADRRADLAEIAVRTTLEEVMSPVTVCVDVSASVRKVRTLLLARDLRAVPVVDAQLKLVGVVSRGDLLTASLEARVEQVTPAKIHMLPEHAPVAYAIAMMAFEGIHEVPVVTDEGELVGMWDATAALRWTAERMGYVTPQRGDQ